MRGIKTKLINRPAPGSASRGAFTLIEVLTAMIIISILMLAIGSALAFSLRISTGQGAINQTNLLAAADAADQIADDLHVASNFTERTTTSVAFAVPDRTGTTTQNQIRYAWDGVSGDPLTRQYLAASSPTLTAASATSVPTTLLGGVTSFSLQYLTRQMGTTATTDTTLLSPSNTLLGSNVNYNIDATHWCSQCVTLSLPSSSSTYTITRVQVYAQTAGPVDAVGLMRVTTASGGKPVTILQQQPLYESALSSSLEYAEVKFTNLSGLTANQPICIVLGYSTGGPQPLAVQYQSALLSILSNAYFSTSTNAGASWSAPASTNNLRMYIYGTVP